MSPILLIARREWLDASRNRAWLLFASALVLLLLCAATVGQARVQHEAREQSRLQSLVAEQWQNQPDRHPHRVAHYGFIAYRQKSPLAFFDFGVDSFTGNSIFLEAHRQNPANFSDARHSTSTLRFGQLSLAYVLQLLMPLLIFFLCFGNVSREREQSTLTLLICQGISDRQIYLGKILGSCGIVAVLWLPTAVLMLGLLALWPQALPPEIWQRAGLLILSYSLYFLLWIVVATRVSARSASSTGSLMKLLSLWAFLFIFLPRLTPSVAEFLWPSPSKPEFELALHLEVASQGNGHDPKDPQFRQLKEELLKKEGKDDLKALSINFNGIAMQEGERRSSAVYASHFQRLQNLYQRQNELSQWVGILDPYLALRNLSMGLSQTDYRHFVDFARQAESFRFSMIDKLNQLHVEEIAYDGDKEHRVSSDHWKKFSSFQYQPPPLTANLREQWLALLSLTGWLLVSLWVLLRTRLEARL